MSGWERFADAVKDTASLMEPYRTAVERVLLPGEAVRQIVYAPPYDSLAGRSRARGGLSWRASPACVLVLTEARLLLVTLKAGEPAPRVSAARIADMLRLELGEILLYAWLEWSWAKGGQLRQERVYFNTVRDDLFWRLLDTVRHDIISQCGPALDGRERDWASFMGLPYKFKNLIPLKLLFEGEHAEATVFQPQVWGHYLGIVPHKRAPVTVAVMTPQHLLFAQDDLSHTQVAYGLTGCYCPRSRVSAFELERRENDLWLHVSLRWQGAEENLRYLFEPQAEPALRTMMAAQDRTTSLMRAPARNI